MQKQLHPDVRDYGDEPLVFNISHATEMNPNFRTTLWTGKHMQLTLMSIPVGGDIGVEMHSNVDQFIRVESGRALVKIGKDCSLSEGEKYVDCDYAVIIPAGTWHNIINVGYTPLKLYSIYAPPQHPLGTTNQTKADAEQEDKI